MKQQWTLYGTLGCHLCEQAQEIVNNLQQTFPIDVQVVDISDDPELVEVFGTKIPVLQNVSLNQLVCWPFSAEALAEWLQFLAGDFDRRAEN